MGTTKDYEDISLEGIGNLVGRDAIYLDESRLDYPESLQFTGEFTASSASEYEGEKEHIPYTLRFTGIVYFSAIELDFASHYGHSSFFVVVDSDRVRKFRQIDHSSKIHQNHREYSLWTYDDVFHMIASGFACETEL